MGKLINDMRKHILIIKVQGLTLYFKFNSDIPKLLIKVKVLSKKVSLILLIWLEMNDSCMNIKLEINIVIRVFNLKDFTVLEK